MDYTSTPYLWRRISYLATLLLLFLLTACGTQIGALVSTAADGLGKQQNTALIAWPAFNNGGQRNAVDTAETTITSGNVAHLVRRWRHTLPAIVDGTLVEEPNVTTTSGVKNLLFVTTKAGSLLALDAANGNIVWRRDTHGPNITTSSPALDSRGQFVYSYGLDGKVHKYAIGSGAEVTRGGWPVIVTLMPDVEKGSSSLNLGNGYLYVTLSGYNGDAGHYNGHIVAVNLATVATTVFNVLCANIRHLLDNHPGDPNYCPDIQAGVWARAGAVIDPVNNDIFITTGNGPYNANAGGHDYGDSVIKLSPDLSTLIDTYTPGNYHTLQQQDEDLGSAAPTMLPPQTHSTTPYLAVQAGKDNTLRLLNRQNLSGAGGPNHVAGELQAIPVPQSCEVLTQPTAWNDPNKVTWVFVANDCGLSALKVVTDAHGHTSLHAVYQNGNGGSSPFVADNILFVQGNKILRAMDPTTGKVLWSSSIGPLHWQSPLIVNGQVYAVDDAGGIVAYGLG
jgi:outer membrane protein assembly factor BamB